MSTEILRTESDVLPSGIDLPFEEVARDDEAMKLGQGVDALPLYTGPQQGHRIKEGEDLVYITGIYLRDASSYQGHYAIYRDPLTGEVYKVRKG